MKKILFLLIFGLVPAVLFSQESITITTYYPSPYGSYNELTLSPHTPANSTCDATSGEGTIYYDSTEKQIKICTGAGGWVSVGSAATTGMVAAFATSTAPGGWLECNGQSISKITYPSLFSAIGYTYGGSGNSFNVPDYRGLFLRGWNNGRTGGLSDPDVASRTGGTGVGSTQVDMYSSHTHPVPWAIFGTSTPVFYFESTPTVHYGILGGNTAASGGNETRPKNIYVMYCIKY